MVMIATMIRSKFTSITSILLWPFLLLFFNFFFFLSILMLPLKKSSFFYFINNENNHSTNVGKGICCLLFQVRSSIFHFINLCDLLLHTSLGMKISFRKSFFLHRTQYFHLSIDYHPINFWMLLLIGVTQHTREDCSTGPGYVPEGWWSYYIFAWNFIYGELVNSNWTF